MKRGEIERICMVEECPRDAQGGKRRCRFGVMNVSVSCGSTYATRVVWGFADVASDGSAYFQIPAEKPVFFLALDREGQAVQRMRSYTHLMPGEVQGCIGCHATRGTLPPEPRLLTWIDLNVPFYGSFTRAVEDMKQTANLAKPPKQRQTPNAKFQRKGQQSRNYRQSR